MDYKLQHLSDAFLEPPYQKKRQGYRLYGFLLATSADREFLTDYLHSFLELHVLTGEEVLLIGPQWGGPVDEKPQPTDDLYAFAEAVSRLHGSSANIARAFLEFLSIQTRESYAVARLLRVRLDSIPAIVFIDRLTKPSQVVVWPLEGMRFNDFLKKFRSILSDLSEQCGWHLRRELKELLRKRVDVYNSEVQNDAINRSRVVIYRNALRQLRVRYDQLLAGCQNVATVEIGKSLVQLESGASPADFAYHFQKHANRWRPRLSTEYQEAVHNLVTIVPVLSGVDLCASPEPSDDLVARIAATESELNCFDSELMTLPRLLRLDAPCPVRGTLESAFETAKRSVPRVFISYSHDTDEHKRSVAKLAQQLRVDGIDCWIDSFIRGPEQGFPRWTSEQIAHADKVLIVCTELYRERFECPRGVPSGVAFEGHLIYQELYDCGVRTGKFVPVLLQDGSSTNIPVILRGLVHFRIPESYSDLRRHILGDPIVCPAPLGIG